MNSLRFLVCLLGAGTLCATGCNSAQAPASPSAFSRPSEVAFACLDVGTASVKALPMESCRTASNTDSSVRLHALVTQTATGEVAAVDLAASRVIDDRRDIPGYTFVDVGGLPSAIVVPEKASEFAYIGNGEGEIGVFSTAAFRPLSVRSVEPRVQEPAISLPGLARPAAIVLAPDESALFVASPSTGELFVVPICRDAGSCEEGSLLEPQSVQIKLPNAVQPVTQGPNGESYVSFGNCKEQVYITGAAAAWPDGGVADGGVADGGTSDAGAIGGDAGAGTSPLGQPRPVALAIDSACDGVSGCAPRLLVSDDALPLIHRFSIDGSTLSPLDPWYPGVPTAALVATPDVRTDVDVSPEAEVPTLTHYVYAIDHRDGSVLVLQDGALLPVNDNLEGRVDRLAFGPVTRGSRALSLEVLTPRPELSGSSCLQGQPESLGGVFLSVGMSDGQLLVYDIEDADLVPATTDTGADAADGMADGDADGGMADADGGMAEGDTIVGSGTCRACPFAIKRHRLRGANPSTAFTAGTEAQPRIIASTVSQAPTYQLSDRSLTVEVTGSTRATNLPELACLPCPSGMARAFPVPTFQTSDDGTIEDVTPGGCRGQSRVCLDADPFRPTGESWFATYEGVLPESAGIGSFGSDGTFALSPASGVNLCGAGVLGSDALNAAGDQLVLLPAPASLARDAQGKCKAMFSALSNGQRAVAFTIEEAYADRLVLDGKNLLSSIADRTTRAGLPSTLEEVTACIAAAGGGAGDSPVLSFNVRSRGSFIVSGGFTGFEHRVRETGSGHCEIDPTAPYYRERRAQVVAAEGGAVFDNGRIAFALQGDPGAIPAGDNVSLVIPVRDANPKLTYNAAFRGSGSSSLSSVLPQVMHYSQYDQRLYVVDPHSRGLISIDVGDFRTGSSNVSQFN